jgi:hypothetical protein
MALDQHIAAARTRLTHLAGLAARTDAAELKILEAAEDRRAAISADIEKLRPRVNLDDEAGDKYMALITERGQLDTVAGRSRQVLGE